MIELPPPSMTNENTASPPTTASSSRRYDKGERRFKHVGSGSEPIIEFSSDNPRMWIGKCPATLQAKDHLRLVNEAISGSNGDREISFPKKIYAVHEGAIYEAQTTDRGFSYHGYPYRGRLPRSLIEALRAVAARKGCQDAFDRWTKEHIEPHGTWP